MKNIYGFTLIEIIIVLAIGSSALLWSVSFSEVVGRNQTAKRLDSDAQLLLETMNQFYQSHCTEVVFPVISENKLRADGILFGAGFNNPWGGSYQLSIDRILPRNPKLQVTVVFNSAIDAGYVAGISDNALAIGNTVVWTGNSSLSRTSDGVRRQLDREAFGTTLC